MTQRNTPSAMAIALLSITSMACSQPTGGAAGSNATGFDSTAAIYLNNCSGCHGARLQGGSGGSLIDGDWKHGSTNADHIRVISEGLPSLGMPAFGKALSPAKIQDLIVYIQQAEKGAAVEPPAAPVKSYNELKTLDYVVAADVWVSDLKTPWAIEFLDERRAIITEKSGPVRLVIDGALLPTPLRNTPEVNAEGQGGMLDVAVDPNFADNGWIYLSYSHMIPGNKTMTRIVRGRILGDAWVDQQIVYEAAPEHYTGAKHHYGNRMVFDKSGAMLVSIGDRGDQNKAQDLSRPNGKVHRIKTDGTIPEDNPFAGSKDVLPTIYSYGHRNPQGLQFHPVTGDLWDAEHGPRGGDEVNLVTPAKNYGWPVITYGINYSGTVITRDRTRDTMEQPVWYWRPSTGVCAIDFYTGDLFPYWKNHLLVGALAFQDLRLLKIENNRVIHEEILMKGIGRVRDVRVGPDGAIYVVLNDPGEVLRLTPKGETKY